jgi:hypothetical protein
MNASSLQDPLISSEPYETREGKVGIKGRNPPQKIFGLQTLSFHILWKWIKLLLILLTKWIISLFFTDLRYKTINSVGR